MFCVGRRDAHVVLGLQDGILVVRMFGDTSGQDILAALQIGHAMGWLKRDCRSLVDIRCFVGTIDWTMLRDINKLTPWSRDRGTNSSYCAYLFGDGLRDWFLSIVAGIYPGAGHRSFKNEADAVAWLATIGGNRDAAPGP